MGSVLLVHVFKDNIHTHGSCLDVKVIRPHFARDGVDVVHGLVVLRPRQAVRDAHSILVRADGTIKLPKSVQLVLKGMYINILCHVSLCVASYFVILRVVVHWK